MKGRSKNSKKSLYIHVHVHAKKFRINAVCGISWKIRGLIYHGLCTVIITAGVAHTVRVVAEL